MWTAKGWFGIDRMVEPEQYLDEAAKKKPARETASDEHYTLVNTEAKKRVGHGTVFKTKESADRYHTMQKQNSKHDFSDKHIKVMTVGDAKKAGVPDHEWNSGWGVRLGVTESVEELEEISKDTLKSYTNKANDNLDALSVENDKIVDQKNKMYNLIAKRSAAENKAHNATSQVRHNKATAEYRAADKAIKARGDVHKDLNAQHSRITRKIGKRMDGLDRAYEKLKEDLNGSLDEDYDADKLKQIHKEFQGYKKMTTPDILAIHKRLRRISGNYTAADAGGKLGMVSTIMRDKHGDKHVEKYFTLGKKELNRLDESLEETSTLKLASYIRKAGDSKANSAKEGDKKAVARRAKGLDMAYNKFDKRIGYKEETDLTEISKDRLVSYMKAAAKDKSKTATEMDDDDYNKMVVARDKVQKYSSPAADRIRKRVDGIDLAFRKYDTNRRANESLEEANSYFTAKDHEAFKKMSSEELNDRHGKLRHLAKNHSDRSIRVMAQAASKELRDKYLKEEKLDESNADNKLKKNIYVAKLGNAADVDRMNYGSKTLKPLSSRARQSADNPYEDDESQEDRNRGLKLAVGKMKRAGRAELKHGRDMGYLRTIHDYPKTSLRPTVKEETLDEISKELMGRYVKKATAELDKDWDDTKKGKLDGLPQRKVVNRFQGVYTARARKANESVEQIDEISKTLAKSYLDKSAEERKANPVYSTREKFRGRMLGGATADAKLKGRVEEPYKFGQAPKRKMRVKIAATESVEQIDENGIKGWKNAASDISKMRSAQGKSVKLVSLKKDGEENRMAEASKMFRSEDLARAHHERVKGLNPTRNIRHNMYIDGKFSEKLE